jgi:deoxyribodipyrimidine photolyase
MTTTTLVWFRLDLRLVDNPAFAAALKAAAPFSESSNRHAGNQI